jgi:hypothetical protein
MAEVITGPRDLSYREDEALYTYGTLTPASDEAVEVMLRADPTNENGRSPWYWLRLPNGDLMLVAFPQGDTYFDVEAIESAKGGAR